MLWSDFLNDDMEHGHLISGLMTTWFICCFCSYSMSCVDQRDRGHRWLRVAPRRGHREVRAQPRQVRTRGQDGPPLGGMAMGWQWDGNGGFRASKDGPNLEIWWNANMSWLSWVSWENSNTWFGCILDCCQAVDWHEGWYRAFGWETPRGEVGWDYGGSQRPWVFKHVRVFLTNSNAKSDFDGDEGSWRGAERLCMYI